MLPSNLTLASCTMELSMVASHLIWRLRTKQLRKSAKDIDQTFDENENCLQWQSQGLDLESKFLRLFSKKDVPHDGLESDGDSTDTFVAPETIVPKTVPNATYGTV
jgi:hypothetical protein